MRHRRRVIAAFVIAVLSAPGTWLRSDSGPYPQGTITFERIAGARATQVPGWRVDGVWAYQGEGLLFGGYSALLALPDGELMAFSDRGARFRFTQPTHAEGEREVARQEIARKAPVSLPDIEAATRDPQTGQYWLAVEMRHALLRYDADHRPDGARRITGAALGWTANRGAEAIARLPDGRFVMMPEDGSHMLVYPGDPVDGAKPRILPVLLPLADHAVTDLAQLPDGRLLVLLRDLDLAAGWPPFASAIAIGAPPASRQGKKWTPQLAIDLAGVLPRENWEAIAVRAQPGGTIALWLIADDNQSVLQRTLVARLLIDPASF